MIPELHAWVLWLGSLLGAIYLVTASVIFAPVRILIARRGTFLMQLVYCPACAGTWLGLALAPAFPALTWPSTWPTVLAFIWWLVGVLCTSGLASMALGMLWGIAIKAASGNVYERELALVYPEKEGVDVQDSQ